MKAISKGCLGSFWSIWMPAALTTWPNKIFELMSMLIIGLYPAGFLMLVYLSEIKLTSICPDAIFVTHTY